MSPTHQPIARLAVSATVPTQVVVHHLRLAPINKPQGFKLRLVYWASRRRFGIVPNGLKVIAPRFPAFLKLSMGLHGVEKKFRLPKELRLLVTALVSATNGCGACLDIKHMLAVQENLTLTKFNALGQHETSNLFSARERAAFRYAIEVTLDRFPSDTTFAELQKHFTEDEVVELTFAVALENFVNRVNIPLGIGSEGLCAIAQARKR